MGRLTKQTASRLIVVVCVAYFGLQSAIRLATQEPIAWAWVAAYATGTFLLVGPALWIARDRIPEKRRENLTYVAFGAVWLGVVVVLGLHLALGGVLVFFDAAMLGGLVGVGIAFLVERTIVPDRLRHPA